ncbi:MAG: 5-oxoprolinase subunit PxpA [Desulfomonilaceae bacterium]|nr:5-oxoprolinase subunit PxpA [Desulfomonilaceae bacterium]
MQIDLNADMGESFGMYTMGNDAEFMKYITSANVACGFHAGDSSVMKRTVGLAKEFGVQVGAHPGLPDLQGFGRREMNLTSDEIYCDVVYQVGALKAFVEAAGMKLHHVKPHGSLYGMAHRREDVASAICNAVRDIDPQLYLYIMKNGVVGRVAESMGVRVVYELYADLGYDAKGGLVITRVHEAHDPAGVAARVVGMVQDGKVEALDGTEIAIEGSSVCVHGDTPGAVEIVTAVRNGLEGAGFSLASPSY